MAEVAKRHQSLTPVAKPLSLIPVGLKEAALDSPTFRATIIHFGEQIDIVEKWLDNYVKSAARLSNEVSSIEAIINTYLSWASPPSMVSEAILDHDYTALALKRYNEGAKEFWSSTLKWMKKVESSVIDPIKAYISTELAGLKNFRRALDQAQKNFDSQISRYAAQSKTKEPSALREDAFQVHEARKAYLKASMDFCIAAPQAKAALDKLLVKIFSERWRDMKISRDSLANNVSKWSGDMDRIRGWSKEMENNERIFKRELQIARSTIEQTAENAIKPSRDLDDYAKSTVAFLGQTPDSSGEPKHNEAKAEKQGWLYQRTLQGKPVRTVWIRRWFYVKHGIFGWLSNNPRNGAVEESDKIGVLLCGVRPAFQEERRFCFEVKTKDTTIELQAETQSELMNWIEVFEIAKRKALENPASTEAIAQGSKSVDAAFAISPPISPEFAAKHAEITSEDSVPERSATITALGLEPSAITSRSSTDIGGRKSFADPSESSRERLMQKLDLHRSRGGGSPTSTPTSSMGGIASLITASHTVLPLGGAGHGATPIPNTSTDFKAILGGQIPPSSLAPSTLANPPALTNMSKTAIAISGEKNLSLGSATTDGGMPGGIMANIWGSNNWGFLNRLERGEVKPQIDRQRSMSQPPSPSLATMADVLTPGSATSKSPSLASGAATPLPHRKTYSMTPDLRALQDRPSISNLVYPSYYPPSLKAQDAQFRTLFPEVRRDDKLVLVFRATWAPNDEQEFPGRAYVTLNDIYFYSNHSGLVLISGVSFDAISEITAAPGKDNDFIFLHLRPDVSVDGASRITMKIYLENLKLLQKRLKHLIQNAEAAEPDGLEDVIKSLLKFETSISGDSPSADSWEDISVNTPVDVGRNNDNRAGLRIDGTLFPDPRKQAVRDSTKFRLPSQPINYTPQGMSVPLVEKLFDITAKALFHVLAGDKSMVFQVLDAENGAQNLMQGPWIQPNPQTHHRREFKYQITPSHNGKLREALDTQVLDVWNDHLCYVLTERRTPWSLPSAKNFSVISKIVVTHVAKAKCKFAVYAKIEWRKRPLIGTDLVERQALNDAELLAKNLVDILTDQVAMLGSAAGGNSRKAVIVFGNVGVSKDILQPQLSDLPISTRDRIRSHSLPSLAIQEAKTTIRRALASLLSTILSAIQTAVKLTSAHHVLVFTLLFSGLANLWFANKDTWGWYHERQAKSFMRSIGVTKGTGLGHSIWLRDLDSLTMTDDFPTIDQALNLTSYDAGSSPCMHNFNVLLAKTDSTSPLTYDGSLPRASTSKSDTKTLSRLQRTRHHFGTYRHDLLVALRVVDRVEKETLRAEWESWVGEEVGKCRVMGRLLESKADTHKDDGVRDAWEKYCGSCERDEKLLQRTST